MTAAVESLLAARGLTKRFGGLVALEQLDLAVRQNEILGLIGPNGSGKTTFFNVVTGIYSADGGEVAFDGGMITNFTAQAVYRAGIARTFQLSRLSLSLSIFDNIMIGNPWGIALATTIVIILPEKLQAIQEYRFLLYAAMVILILLFRPQGLLPRPLRSYIPGWRPR